MPLSKAFKIHTDVQQALKTKQPIVALESAVITHGLPHPQNLSLAQDMETIVKDNGATPATIALLDGEICIGLNASQLERLATMDGARKISRRDFSLAISQKLCGGTTVAGTMIAASQAGIRVFATGGIGGVHRNSNWDVSADLPELGRTPMIIICAGAKAILDLPATLEYLETCGVLVVGYQTDEFPAFYSRHSGIKLDTHLDSPEEIANVARAQWEMGLTGAVLVVQSVQPEFDLPPELVESYVNKAMEEAQRQGIHGPATTPFLLDQVKTISGGASLTTNIALLKNNALLAAQIARALRDKPLYPSI
jgi:pseudouridylate synthase